MTKRTVQLGAMIVAIALGTTISATASLISSEAEADKRLQSALAVTPEAAEPVTKSDRRAKIESLEHLKPLQVRCVSQAQGTTCTGWPTAAGTQVSGL